MHDTLSCGRRFRALNIVDAHSRECLAVEVDTSLTGERVVRVLEQLREQRGTPQTIQVDNGSEFTGRKLDEPGENSMSGLMPRKSSCTSSSRASSCPEGARRTGTLNHSMASCATSV